MHRRSIAFVAALVAMAIATAACSSGGDNSSAGNTSGGSTSSGGNALGGQLTHDQYQQKITQIAQDFKQQQAESFGSLGSIQNPDDLPKAADAFSKAADEFDSLADELNGINPPDDAAAANAKLVTGFHAVADAFRQFADAAAAKDLQKLEQLGTQLQSSPAIKGLDAAENELKKAGYTVPNSGSTSGPTTS